jgi:hypothetical protein
MARTISERLAQLVEPAIDDAHDRSDGGTDDIPESVLALRFWPWVPGARDPGVPAFSAALTSSST